MNEITHTREFNWKNWFIGVSRWFSIMTIFFFVAKIGMQNGIFEDFVMKTIALFGFVGYIAATGLHLINKSSPEFWIYHEIKKE